MLHAKQLKKNHTIGSAMAVVQVRVRRTRRATVKQTYVPDWWRRSRVWGHTHSLSRLELHTLHSEALQMLSVSHCVRKEGLTMKQLPSVKAVSLWARSEGSDHSGGAQLLLQLFVELQLLEAAVLLDAVLQLRTETPHLP